MLVRTMWVFAEMVTFFIGSQQLEFGHVFKVVIAGHSCTQPFYISGLFEYCNPYSC